VHAELHHLRVKCSLQSRLPSIYHSVDNHLLIAVSALLTNQPYEKATNLSNLIFLDIFVTVSSIPLAGNAVTKKQHDIQLLSLGIK